MSPRPLARDLSEIKGGIASSANESRSCEQPPPKSCLSGNSALQIEPSLVGPVGIEPTTCGLKVRCSTAELKALANSVIKGTTARTHSGVRIRVGGICLWRRVNGSIPLHQGVSRRARRCSIPPVPFRPLVAPAKLSSAKMSPTV